MEKAGLVERPQFTTPEEELTFLRSRVAEQEKLLSQSELSRVEITRQVLKDYQEELPSEVLASHFALNQPAAQEIILHLSPELHDTKMEELIALVQEKGIKNALSLVAGLHDPHLTDDFHRFLVAYLGEGYPIPGLKDKDPVRRVLEMTLYEIQVPDLGEDRNKSLKELLGAMEQWYAGMAALGQNTEGGADYFTLELAVANQSSDFIFYAGIPTRRRDLFEKQLLAVFPKAQIKPLADDYNIFNAEGVAVGAVASLQESPLFALKTYEDFDYDPLNVVLQSFSKIDEAGEGAAIQLVFHPAPASYSSSYERALTKLRSGAKRAEVADNDSFWVGVAQGLKEVVLPPAPKKKTEADKISVDEVAVKNLERKIASPLAQVNLRLAASAGNRERAEAILADLEAAFRQFEQATSNRLAFQRLKAKKLEQFFRDFSFRVFRTDQSLPLNLKEVTALWHLPTGPIFSGQLKQAKASHALAPNDLGNEGVVLGRNQYQGKETAIHFAAEDRLRHLYLVGQTGTGKSTLIKNLLVQDIKNGEGVCFIDPHGVDLDDVLAAVPRERYEDVVYFDPSSPERPLGLNLLEYDERFPEQKTFVVNELISIFNKLFDMKTVGGPMFEQYFRNAVLLVLEDPASGATLLDVSRVLSHKTYREMKLAHCHNPLLTQFWREVAEKAGGEAALANIVPYITSKFDVFLTNDIMRPIVAQEHSSFNFRTLMDERKILLVNLAKGRLGEINANLIGLILVGKILMAALSRTVTEREALPPFYLYLDEFQNITTDSIATILSEARKYKLSLTVAHQFIAQLEEKIKAAVFGNVGSLAVFRVGAPDAEFLAKQFEPVFSAQDLMNIDNRQAYLKLLVNGKTTRPFDFAVAPPPGGDPAKVVPLKELSGLKYGQPRDLIEAAIIKKYQK